jgi:predicted GNAT family N-acyltransferase
MNKLSYAFVENDSDLEEAFQVRREVFVEQQELPESIVFDDLEEAAMHIVVKFGDQATGSARIRFLGARQAKLERMAVLKAFRNMGIGRGIISFMIENLRSREVEDVVLHAQQEVVEFYGKCGFEQTGSPFREAGIEHLKMERRL